MKTAMKKIMTLLLVAMLLVTAIPFTAFAADGDGILTIGLFLDGNWVNRVQVGTPGMTVNQAIAEVVSFLPGKYPDNYTYEKTTLHKYDGDLGSGTLFSGADTIVTKDYPFANVYLSTKRDSYSGTVYYYQFGTNVLLGKYEFTKTATDSGLPAVTYNEIKDHVPAPQNSSVTHSLSYVDAPDGNRMGDTFQGEAGRIYDGHHEVGTFSAYVNVNDNGGNSGGDGGNQPTESKKVTLTVKEGSTTLVNAKTIELTNNSASLKNILYYHWNSNWENEYNFVSDSLGRGKDGTIKGGESVTVAVSSKNKPTEPSVKDITYIIKIGTTADNAKESFRGSFTPAQNGASKVGDILTNKWNSKWKNSYKFENAYVKVVGDLGENDYVKAGQTVTIRVSSKSSSGGSTGGDHNKFPYNVYLHVYLNNNLDSAHKTFDITDGIAADGVVDKNDIWNNLLKNYYSAKDSKGVKIELYKATGNWVKDFAADKQVSSINNILDLRDDGYVHINVVLNNAKSKTSSSNADPNNPKTGDSIGTVISVMGLSATALATMFFFNKKRIFG